MPRVRKEDSFRFENDLNGLAIETVMKATRSIRFFGVMVLALGLLMVWSVFWKAAPDPSDGGAMADRVADGETGPGMKTEPSTLVDRGGRHGVAHGCMCAF